MIVRGPRGGARSTAYYNPAPEGVPERVDAGKDYGNIRGNIVAVTSGIITNIYQNLSGFRQTIIEKTTGGQDVYYGLETGGVSTAHVGEPVTGGTPIARGLGTGGIEVGFWNPATGRPVGQYTEGGPPTAAGTQFANMVSGGGSGGGTDLAQLWIDAGGPPNVANIMAAIAMAESGGQNIVQKGQPYATTGWGLWQITPGNSVPSIGTDQQLLDPMTNARAAVAKYRSQGLSAWTTYTSGAYLKYMSTGATTPAPYGGTRPGGQPANQQGTQKQALDDYVALRDAPRAAVPGTKNPFQWWWASFSDSWSKLNSPAGS